MKKILSTFLATGLLLSSLTVTQASALDAENLTASEPLEQIQQKTLTTGKCGDNASYEYEFKSGHLQITGTGPLYDYELLAGNPSPWQDWDVTTVEVGEGITTIGDTMFRGQEWLETVVLPESLHTIGYEAFYRCIRLEQIYIPNGVTTVGSCLFSSPYDSVASYSPPVRTLTVYGSANSPVKEYCDYSYLAYEVVESRPYWDGNRFFTYHSYPDWLQTFATYAEKDIITDLTVSNYGEAVDRGLLANTFFILGDGELTSDVSFTDARDMWVVLGWCYDMGIMTGKSDSYFGLEDSVTREEMALILQKFAESQGKYGKGGSMVAGDSSVLAGYSDKDEISAWATGGMAWAVANGLMSGSENALNPRGSVTRAELAVMLYQYAQV